MPPFPDGVDTEENRFAVSLADYRHLYKTYLGDPHLQAARANWPFICTWDDHEFANKRFPELFSLWGRQKTGGRAQARCEPGVVRIHTCCAL